jgi:formylglycine-generating enzyme required for sulfatase activity
MGGCFIVQEAVSAWVVSGGKSHLPASDGGRGQRQELFISYSHKDRDFLERFWIHLKPLEMLYGLQRWDDSLIQPGDCWLQEIECALGRAQAALLLVSADFLASDFIQRQELPKLFEAASTDGLKILWLPIRPCSWKLYRMIEQYQCVGSVDPTLAEMSRAKREREIVNIIDCIYEVFVRNQGERNEITPKSKDTKMFVFGQGKKRLTDMKVASLKRYYVHYRKRLKAEHGASVEAKRRRAERKLLASKKEELHCQMHISNTSSRMPSPMAPADKAQPIYPSILVGPRLFSPSAMDPAGEALPQLIQINGITGTLVREGSEWQMKEKPIIVKGYTEELAQGIAIKMIQIPAGNFLMGSLEREAEYSEAERPQHPVQLMSFFMGQTPVTQAQWKVVASWPKVELDLQPDPSFFSGDNRPVEQINLQDAREFCRRMTNRTGHLYTLPSEAQWEFACRAGTSSAFAFGEMITTELVNYNGGSRCNSYPIGSNRGQTIDVGGFPGNLWGLHDMHGNVWEWCSDHWHRNYERSPIDGTPWMNVDNEKNGRFIIRGGSWINDSTYCRSAYRVWADYSVRAQTLGFRICCLRQGIDM